MGVGRNTLYVQSNSGMGAVPPLQKRIKEENHAHQETLRDHYRPECLWGVIRPGLCRTDDQSTCTLPTVKIWKQLQRKTEKQEERNRQNNWSKFDKDESILVAK